MAQAVDLHRLGRVHYCWVRAYLCPHYRLTDRFLWLLAHAAA